MHESYAPSEIHEHDLLNQLQNLIAQYSGIQTQHADIARAVSAVGKEQGIHDLVASMHWIFSGSLQNKLQLLINQLTIGETYFFRDEALFNFLHTEALPKIIYKRRAENQRYLRIWSAGCCTGEEAYSVAILLARLLPDIEKWKISILATDINHYFLEKASRGIYDQWSFRQINPDSYKPYIYASSDGKYAVSPNIKSMVSFKHLNLAGDSYPSPANNTTAFDIVFCRNVLMYLHSDRARAAIQRLVNSLVPDGWLITSTVESSLVSLPELKAIHFPDLVVFHKTEIPVTVPAIKNVFLKKGYIDEDDLVMPRSEREVIKKISDKDLPNPADKNEIGSLIDMARRLANQGDVKNAIECCRRVIAMDRFNKSAMFLQGSIFAENGKMAEAEQAFKKILYLDHNSVMARISLGNMFLMQSNRSGESRQHFFHAREALLCMPPKSIVDESDGHTAAQLLELVEKLMGIKTL